MYFHWQRDFFHGVLASASADGNSDTHYWVAGSPNTQFFDAFGLVSDYCWQVVPAIPAGVCYCQSRAIGASHGSGGGDHSILFSRLNLSDVTPTAPRLALISRLNKRFILNEHELMAVAREMGIDAVLLPFEAMTLYEQVRELRRATILMGIHGSGLINAWFMHPQTILVQLMPFKVRRRAVALRRLNC